MGAFLEAYVVELLLVAGVVVSTPLARFLVQDGPYKDKKEQHTNYRAIQLFLITLFTGLLILSVFVF